MALNIQFQNLNQANGELLKAFNSAVASKALEAYQPLDAKERAKEKLRALQTLKQESASRTLADINLNKESLASALNKTDGPTLQAMLNLLSAKMIEQHKNTFFEVAENNAVTKVSYEEEQNEQEQEEQHEEEEQDEAQKNFTDQIVDAAEEYLKIIRDKFVKLYSGVLDTLSLQKLRKLFNDNITQLTKAIKKYAYDLPIEVLDEYLISPVYNLPTNLKKQVEENISKITNKNKKKTFTATEIKEILNSSIDSVRTDFNDMLERSITNLESSFNNKLSKEKSTKRKAKRIKRRVEQQQVLEKVDASWSPKVIVNNDINSFKAILHKQLSKNKSA